MEVHWEREREREREGFEVGKIPTWKSMGSEGFWGRQVSRGLIRLGSLFELGVTWSGSLMSREDTSGRVSVGTCRLRELEALDESGRDSPASVNMMSSRVRCDFPYEFARLARPFRYMFLCFLDTSRSFLYSKTSTTLSQTTQTQFAGPSGYAKCIG